MDLDILFSDAHVLLPGGNVISRGYVGVKDTKIAYVGDIAQEANRVIPCGNKAIIPGFINAHTHIPMTLLRGFADGHSLQDWLENYIFPAESKMTDDMAYVGTHLGLMECLAFGTVSISDMYDHCDSIARAVAESGMKANISRGMVHFEKNFERGTSRGYQEAVELADKWHGFDNGRILTPASIHAEYTSPEKLWRAAAEFAQERGLGVHVHVSETKQEHDECIKRRGGATPLAALESYGLWNGGGVAAHCVWSSEEDMRLCAARGISVIHNPTSNLLLASGVARVPLMLSLGVNVALGTDGMASNHNHDMFEEMKIASIIQKKETGDPTVMPPEVILDIASTGGARAQGRENETGRIEEGYDADIVVIDLDKPHLTPVHSLSSLLVYAAKGTDVYLTMVRGKVLYQAGNYLTIDREKIMYQARRMAGIFA